MTALARVLHTEALKLKRTIAWKMVFLAPLAVVLLVMFMAVNAPFSMVMRGGPGREWAGLAQVTFLFWAALMMPLYITLQCALVAGVDHAENQWKSLFARPAPRWTWYAAKLIVVMIMLAVSSIVLLCGILTAAVLLPWLQPELAFRLPVPWASLQLQALQIAVLALLALAIQHFVSLWWRSFSVAMGVGIVALVVGYVATVSTNQTPGWPQYFPWSLPMLVLSKHPQDVAGALWISVILGVSVTALGCVVFCRREVS